MDTVKFPVSRSDGVLVQLTDVLAMVPDNDWTWSIIEFDGIGRPPDGLSMDAFEKTIRESPAGFTMSWSGVETFSQGLIQTIDSIIVAVENEEKIQKIKGGTLFSLCEIVIDVFDSTEWSLWARDKELMERFGAFFS